MLARGSLDVSQEFQLPLTLTFIRTLTRLDRWARFGFPESERGSPRSAVNSRGNNFRNWNANV